MVLLDEYKIDRVIDLQVAQPKIFKLKNSLIRTSISDPALADVFPTNDAVYAVGKKAGSGKLSNLLRRREPTMVRGKRLSLPPLRRSHETLIFARKSSAGRELRVY